MGLWVQAGLATDANSVFGEGAGLLSASLINPPEAILRGVPLLSRWHTLPDQFSILLQEQSQCQVSEDVENDY